MTGDQIPIGAYCARCYAPIHLAHQQRYLAQKAKPPSPHKQIRNVEALGKAAAAAVAEAERLKAGVPEDAQSLLHGAAALNESAEGVMQQMAEAIENPKHPWHSDALKFAANRILPQSTIDTVALQLMREVAFGELGAKRGASQRPQFTVLVCQTNGPEHGAEGS